MDPSRLPSSSYSTSGVPHDAGSSAAKTTLPSPMWPTIVTGAPNVFPQSITVVGQQPQVTYAAQISASNSLHHVPNQHFQPQTTFFNQTVRENGDSSVQTRFMYISSNFVRHPNNLTFVEQNRTMPSFVHRGSTPVIEGIRPIATTTIASSALLSNGKSRPISVRWDYSGRDVRNVSSPALSNVTLETPAVFTQGQTLSDPPVRVPDSPVRVPDSQNRTMDSRSSLPQIPSHRVYPSNDPRLNECAVRIPPILKTSRPQRDPRSGTIVRRILARFSGSHGSVPPVDPRSKPSPSTSTPHESRRNVTQATNMASAAVPAFSSSGPENPSQATVGAASGTPLTTPPRPDPSDPATGSLKPKAQIVEKKTPTKIPTSRQNRNQLSTDERQETEVSQPNRRLDSVVEESTRADPETTIDRNVPAGQTGDLTEEQPPIEPDDEESRSSESPPPEDPRQKHSSRVCDSRSLEAASHHVSPIFDDADDPRLRSSRVDRSAEGKRNKSVYNFVPRGTSRPDRSQNGDGTKSALDLDCSEITASRASSLEGGAEVERINRPMNAGITVAKEAPKKAARSEVYSEPSSSETISASENERSSRPINSERDPVTQSSPVLSGKQRTGTEVETVTEKKKKQKRKRRHADRILCDNSTAADILEGGTRNSRRPSARSVISSDSDSREPGIASVKKRMRRRRLIAIESNEDSVEHPNPAKKLRPDVFRTPEEMAVRTEAPIAGPSNTDFGGVRLGSDSLPDSQIPLPDRSSGDLETNSMAPPKTAESSPDAMAGARLRSDEELELREKHERENAKLVYEKTREFNRAFRTALPLRVRDDQMVVLIKTLTDIIEKCPPSSDLKQTKPCTSGEPKKKGDPVEVHQDETTEVHQDATMGVQQDKTMEVRQDGTVEVHQDETVEGLKEVGTDLQPEAIDQNAVESSEKDEATSLHETRDESTWKLLKPFEHLEIWSPYATKVSKTPLPAIVLRDIQLGTSTTRRLRLNADEIRRRELFCTKCSFVSLNNLSLEKHIGSFHSRKS